METSLSGLFIPPGIFDDRTPSCDDSQRLFEDAGDDYAFDYGHLHCGILGDQKSLLHYTGGWNRHIGCVAGVRHRDRAGSLGVFLFFQKKLVGLSSLETLVSMYVGLELFGISGLLLGPVGLLLVEDLVKLWAGQEQEE